MLADERKAKLQKAEEKTVGEFAPRRDALIHEQDAALSEKRARYAEARMVADAARQEREAQRERGRRRRRLETAIAVARRQGHHPGQGHSQGYHR